jgi:protein gp37
LFTFGRKTGKMNKTTIEFADFTFNPLVGCQIGCGYCWARKFNDRYFKTDFRTPIFHEKRLLEKIPKLPKERNDIAALISPDKPVIFIVDMGDIFSPGVSIEWQNKILDYVTSHNEANFLFLSKRPEQYHLWGDLFPKNTFIGTSLDFAHHYKRIEPIVKMAEFGYGTFVNIEPLMSRMDGVDFSGVEFVIVGALTGRKYNPDSVWHKSIKHPVIFYKKNYQVYFPELINNRKL